MSMFSAPAHTTPAPATPTFARPGATVTRGGPPPTGEQSAVVDAYLTGQHVTIEALAGTGKTTSLRIVAAARPDRPGAYIAYNKAIADEAAGRFPARVVTGTAHSFAFQSVGRRYAHRLPSRYGQQSSSRRLPAFEVAEMLRLNGVRISGGRYFNDVALARLAEATVTAFCQSAADDITADHVPLPAGVDQAEAVTDLVDAVLPAAHAMWADILNPAGRLWFTHDHYLKMWQLTGPVLPVEYVMLDEAQDANPVIAAIVAAQHHAQLVYVGDRNQQLYAWRGAVDAMSTFDGLRLPLTKSFRFGDAIAAAANEWLGLLGCDLRVSGHEPITSTVGHLAECDAILCRTNGGAVGSVIDAQERGRKVSLVGDGTEVKRFAFAAKSLMAGKGCDLPELAAFKTWRALTEYVEEEHSGQDLKVLVKLVQRYGPSTLIDTINALVPAKRADLVVSTAHKAKGLEWPRVQIGGDFAPPLDGAEAERAELMLAYVAVTRAQHQLDRGSLDWLRTGQFDDAARWFSYDIAPSTKEQP